MSADIIVDNIEGSVKDLLEEKQCKAIYALVPYFSDVVILGDSMAESILDFRLLRKNNVIAKRGRCVDMIEEDIQKVIRLSPKVIFMEYGKNDILHFHGNESKFINIYRERIAYLRKALPATTVLVHSIIPMNSLAMKKRGGIEAFNRFNKAIELMCEVDEVRYVDNSSIIDWSDSVYEYDGIHPKYPFYPKWLYHMAEQAGLMKAE